MRLLYRSIITVSLGALVFLLPLGVAAQSSFTRLPSLTQEQSKKLQKKEKDVTFLVTKITVGVAAAGLAVCALLFFGLFRPTKRFSRDAAFTRAWGLVRQYKWLLAGLLLAQEAVMIIFQLASAQLVRQLFRWKYNAILVGSISGVQRALIAIFGAVIFLYIIKILLAMHDASFMGMKKWKRYLPAPKVLIVYVVAVILSWFAILGGALLLVIPGIIAFVALQFYPMLLLDGKARGPLQALRMSAAMTRGCRFDLFLLLFLLGALNVAGFLVFFVGLLVTIPLSLLVLIDVYRQLSPATTSSQPLPAQPATKSRITRSNA